MFLKIKGLSCAVNSQLCVEGREPAQIAPNTVLSLGCVVLTSILVTPSGPSPQPIVLRLVVKLFFHVLYISQPKARAVTHKCDLGVKPWGKLFRN